MSIVACRVDGKGYTVAADSITVRELTQQKGDRTSHSKLFEVKGLLVGGVGAAEETSLFQIFAATHHVAAASESAILEFLSEFSSWKKKKIDNATLENRYLLGVADCVFYVNGWYVTRVSTFEAIGAGQDFALAALHLGHTPEEAVRVAIELSVYCEGPIQELRRRFKE